MFSTHDVDQIPGNGSGETEAIQTNRVLADPYKRRPAIQRMAVLSPSWFYCIIQLAKKQQLEARLLPALGPPSDLRLTISGSPKNFWSVPLLCPALTLR